MADAELSQAWAEHEGERERSSFITAMLLAALLLPAWSIIDYLLQRPCFGEFLLMRAALGVWALGWAVWLARGGSRPRLGMGSVAALLGLFAGYASGRVDNHYEIYCLGFSLIYLGVALLVRWPPKLTLATYVLYVGAHVGFGLGRPPTVSTQAFLGMTAYLISLSAVCVGFASLRMRLERQAFSAAFDLKAKNGELSRALETLREAQERFVATEKLSALGRLLAQLSHEINNPVNVLKNNVAPVTEYVQQFDKLLALAQTQPDPGEVLKKACAEAELDFIRRDIQDALGSMAGAAERLRSIHNDLRGFMRGEGLVVVDSDLNQCVRSTAAMLRRNLPAGAKLVESYAALPPVHVNVGQINQLVLNLLQNAFDAIGENGQVSVETRAESAAVVLEISDDGPEVPEAVRARLFEPFLSTKQLGKGTGLGLATCYQIARAHGGEIRLDTGHSPGAKFVVSLPV